MQVNDIKLGDSVVDVSWWSRISPDGLEFRDTGEVRSVDLNRVCHINVRWGRVKQGARRNRARDMDSRTLSGECDEDLEKLAQEMLEADLTADEGAGSDIGYGTEEDLQDE